MNHLRVAVLRGGPSEEYQVSMQTGRAVLAALLANTYQIKDVVITRSGQWLDGGVVRQPEIVLKGIDVVFIALHGGYGEDGEVQKIIQRLGIPFTGSRSFASAIAFNKAMTKKILQMEGIKMPQHREVSYDEKTETVTIANEIATTFGPEYIIKPVASGSSFGVKLVGETDDLAESIALALESHDRVLVEEYIRGKEATAATLEKFRNNDVYVFPVVEIVPPINSRHFNTSAKYDGNTEEICPARFSYSERREIAEITALVHKTLDLAQYSRSDFILNDSGVYFLEVNTLPGLTPESLYPKAAASVGLNMNDLVEHLVKTATC